MLPTPSSYHFTTILRVFQCNRGLQLLSLRNSIRPKSRQETKAKTMEDFETLEVQLSFPGGLNSKDPTHNAGDVRVAGSIPD